ncbi:MAG TPA: glycosyltransferase family 4 protein [Chloroflexota bacterium]|nr:glycosyltransferase family 4 protein [Chloroflexota bacterium]
MSRRPAARSLRVRHLVPALGRVPRPGTPEGTSGLVGSALGIARAQAGRGHRVELHGWRPDGGPGRYGLDGVDVRVTPGWRWARIPRIDGRVIAPLLAGAAVAGPADVVQAYTDPHLLLAPRARARVLHFQTPVPASPTGFYGRLAGRADLIVCCSDFIGRQVRSRLDFRPDRVAVVHNGVDLARFAAAAGAGREAWRRRWRIDPDEFVLLYVGAVVPQKGLLHLLHALARLRPARPCRLLVAGGAGLWPTADEPYPKETGGYAGAVREAGEALPVTWLGVVSQEEMPGLYALADLFVCPSEWDEPFGTVNVEAMAAGTPVVASRVGGIPEAVTDGETGLLVPPADPPALAAALEALIDDAGRRHRMAAAARARAAAFTWERAAARLDELYREVLG